jgi:hypothetical protein
VLSFFRSQHNNQSWLGALITILDASALLIAGIEGIRSEQAKVTFAMARHAVVDLAQVLTARYDPYFPNRLPPAELANLRRALAAHNLHLREGRDWEQKLTDLRALYEPYAQSMGRGLAITLPPWIHPEKKKDNWQTGPWDRVIQARGLGGQMPRMDEHF